ncbi:MAG: Asp-tRNA(Asn)/Glu-tRNA(Gln) amidotransferase subunit GatB [Clostridia bacterium]|nr:Asp-tRNA(Asn)/Glu-tRNA(Gln) amidotransferase subunit GatB [Clostridia bacterium]
MKSEYEINIGLEIHAELKTNTKVFCSCRNAFGSAPNTNVCPVCIGLPGSLPVLNKEALICAIKAGLSLGSDISPKINFDRKHYFYPDLPKAYQISQNENPVCIGGGITLSNGKFVRFNHIHLEEDAGKLVHDELTDQTFIDYNRGGVPLIEHVTEVDLSSADEAVEFLTKLRQTLVFAGVADCKMEQGGMRCDVNLSVRKKTDKWFGTKVEMKNLNSFRSVHRAIEYEANRQIEALEKGEKIIQETRRWDDNKGYSYAMRTKEESKDYRYMPEPDIISVLISSDEIEKIKAELPETPSKRFEKYTTKFALPEYDANILISEKFISDYFENCCKLYAQPKTISNWIMTDLLKLLKYSSYNTLDDIISAPYLCAIIKLLDEKKISRNVSKELLLKVIETKESPLDIANREKLIEVIDTGAIYGIVDAVLAEKPDLASQYKVEPDKITNFIVGAVMKQTKGKADATLVKEYVAKKLG